MLKKSQPHNQCRRHGANGSRFMKLYLDDKREAPVGWVRVDNVKDCITILTKCNVIQLSLDHDLGTIDGSNGYDVLLWLEQNLWAVPNHILIHSANPPARDRMLAAVKSIFSRRITDGAKCTMPETDAS